MSGPGLELLTAVLGALPPAGAGAGVAVVRRDRDWVVGAAPEEVVSAVGRAALDALDGLRSGWWAGWLSYDLGRSVEAVAARRPDDLGLPDLVLARFDARLVIGPDGGWRVEGHGAGRRALEGVASQAAAAGPVPTRSPALGSWRSNFDAAGYEAGVRAIVALIEAGDCYQVNLTRRLTCDTPADPVDLFVALTRENPAPHAALVSLPGLAAVSASPERYLRRCGDVVETRPIKGTAATADVLAASIKDRAENVMITDLARNDLGRVCRYGTVAVPSLCGLEPHPGLWHLVSTVTGSLRPGVGFGELVRATFPPASVTGAPKPRVLQVIEDLEPARRGVYCGALGWIDADRDEADLNVAIRTFTVTGDATHLGVGAGITAGSDPAAEWWETELKASRLLAAAGALPLRQAV